MIAVIGATGNTGRATVKELKNLGENPLCVVRNPDKAREVLGADARTVVAEVTDRPALEKALKGVKSVFVVTGHNPQTAEQQINVLEAAKAAGVENIVKVSGGRAIVRPDSETVVGRAHYQVEEAIKKSGLRWCILRPGLFMQNTLAQAPLIKSESKMVLPFAKNLPLAFIDVRDTGALGARVLRDIAPHAGKTYEFTGALSNYEEFAKVFSEVLGRTITYVAATLEQAEQAMRARNMPDWLVNHMLTIARVAEKGAFSTENTQPIRDIVGRPPLTLRQFVQDHKAIFT
ncbi:MAG TPA: NmrA family NAD(P)-binding protein [Xanthobacteraceae bacterium]|nr:NmrA family NAD(P)-binding protein [Xanthobacteraceae bacterium]